MNIHTRAMMRPFTVALAFFLCLAPLAAQRPVNAPATGPAGKPPDTVFLEDLTWAEVRDLVKDGWTTAIMGTAGTEQKGPHIAAAGHRSVAVHSAIVTTAPRRLNS